MNSKSKTKLQFRPSPNLVSAVPFLPFAILALASCGSKEGSTQKLTPFQSIEMTAADWDMLSESALHSAFRVIDVEDPVGMSESIEFEIFRADVLIDTTSSGTIPISDSWERGSLTGSAVVEIPSENRRIFRIDLSGQINNEPAKSDSYSGTFQSRSEIILKRNDYLKLETYKSTATADFVSQTGSTVKVNTSVEVTPTDPESSKIAKAAQRFSEALAVLNSNHPDYLAEEARADLAKLANNSDFETVLSHLK